MVTIYDIAKEAGVAKSTVANALTGKGKVSEATRQRVLQCAREMGYRPNVLARNLSQHKTLTAVLTVGWCWIEMRMQPSTSWLAPSNSLGQEVSHASPCGYVP